jgi:hypothetical protein
MKKAFFQLHLAVFLAGFTAILGKLIHLNEGWLVWYRMLITVVAIYIILFLKKELKPVSIKKIAPLLGTGCIIALHWLTFYASVKYSNASIALVCFSATGLFTALFEPLITKSKFMFLEILLGFIVVTGIYIIFNFNPHFKTGIIFGIISAMGAAIFPILNKGFLPVFPHREVTFYEMIGGFVGLSFLLPLYFIVFPAPYAFTKVSDWIWLLILSILCTVYALNLQLKALKKISAFTSNLTYSLEPVYGILLAFLIFHEHKYFGPSFYWGMLLSLIAVILQMYVIFRSQAKARG